MAVTVVIPTRNRIDTLRETIDALATQDLRGHQAEVVVVDNGSTDGTARWLREAGRGLAITLRIVTEPSPGVSAARNTGVRHARYELILLLDDDSVPCDPDLLVGHMAAHAGANGEEIAILGRIAYPPEELTDPFVRWLCDDDAQFAYARLDRGKRPRASHFYTPHISFPRAAYIRAGGMDERLPYGFDDAALGHRMELQGVPIHYHPELIVHHHHTSGVREWRRRMRVMGRAGWKVNQLYPSDPPLAQRASAPLWATVAAAAGLLGLFSTDWRWPPGPIRTWIYRVVHFGSYARGYREAARASGGEPC